MNLNLVRFVKQTIAGSFVVNMFCVNHMDFLPVRQWEIDDNHIGYRTCHVRIPTSIDKHIIKS